MQSETTFFRARATISDGRTLRMLLSVSLLAAIAGCATDPSPRAPIDTPGRAGQPDESARAAQPTPVKPVRPHESTRAPAHPPAKSVQGPALLERLIPSNVANRPEWAAEIYSAFIALRIAPTAENMCAVIAVTEQESGFRADPSVPGLSDIAWKEMEKQRERIGVPKVVVQTALKLQSSDGKSYSERLDTVKTERQLSDLYEDFIGKVPMGKTFFSNRNPVRTGGPMQVSVAFAEKHAASRTYPYAASGSIRQEVFTRRGGIYFGVAHLLDYPTSYNSHIYRFADFNAGQFASRNAAFQNAVTLASGTPLDLDGDVLRYEQGQPVAQPSNTELAARALAARLDMSASEIRRDLERGTAQEFERTRVFLRVFALADRLSVKPVPRALVPSIVLHSPKFTRKLTTAWYASRVDDRNRRCLARAADAGAANRDDH
jgi:hypothetical protein